jgi:hypothetical protein
MLGVQAPKVAAAPVEHAPDDSWDVAPTHVEDRAAQGTPAAPTLATAAVTPVAPPVLHPLASPAPPAAHPVAHPVGPGLNAGDVRLIVRTIVEDALLPLQRALVEAQQRIADLERRPATAAATVVLSATPSPAGVAPAMYTSAMAASVPAAIAKYSMPPAPLLDVAAIERDVPLDFNNPFNGARRRRRMAVFVVVALLAIFGGLFALLADSYTPHH